METVFVILLLVIVWLIVPWMMAPALSEKGTQPFFSNREWYLWLWALLVLVAIYSTIGFAGRLTEVLRERNMLRISFAVVVFVVGGIFTVKWAKRRPSRAEIGVALGITAVYLMTMIRIATWEERSHLFEYGLVAILIYQALVERRRNGHRVPLPAVLAMVVTALLGWLDEGIQIFLPDRVYDLRDVGFNALAGVMAIVASVLMAKVRQLWSRRKRAAVDREDRDRIVP